MARIATCPRSNDEVEDGCEVLVLRSAQHASSPLHKLSRVGAAGEHVRGAGLGNIDAFVQASHRHEGPELLIGEAAEDARSFASRL